MNNKIKRILLVFNLLGLLLFSTSCMGSRELDTLGIVITVGLDFEDGKIIITNEIINPISGTSSTGMTSRENSIFVQGRGDTLEDAVANISTHFNRTPYYPHNHLIILGEEFVKRGIGDYIDLLSRENEQREQAFMLVAKGAKAYDVMGINGGMSNSAGRYLFEMIERGEFNEKTRTLTIDEFLRYFYRQREGVILGVVKEIERPQIDKDKSDNKIYALDVSGGAVLKDGRLRGYFNEQEMIGFNFIIDEVKEVAILFQAPNYLVDNKDIIGRKGEYSLVRVFRNRTKKDIKLTDGKLHLSIDTVFRGSLREENQGLDISKEGVLEAMEKSCGDQVELYIKMAMDKAQSLNIDTFGIGTLVHQKYPEIWREIEKDWIDIFSTLDYTVNVESYINATGFTNTPSNLMKGK